MIQLEKYLLCAMQSGTKNKKKRKLTNVQSGPKEVEVTTEDEVNMEVY
jgi:hypothetical protein